MKRKLLYLMTEDWFFVAHCLPLACAAQSAGYEVKVIARENQHGDIIRKAGLDLVAVDFSRSHGRPWQDLLAIISIYKVYRQFKPDLVHHIALKPVLFGGLVVTLARVPVIINTLTGLGFVFSSQQKKAKFLRLFISPLLKWLLGRKNAWLNVENPDDDLTLKNAGILRSDYPTIIRGSGVDEKQFAPIENDNEVPIIILAARMLWDKGVGEFVEAAKILKASDREVRFVLVGDSDSENPACISQQTLSEWQSSGIIEWWGQRDNMPEILANSTLVCLPSYREGLPKVLIEAAACGKAIVTTDAPGCRVIVQHGINGLLVPIKDAKALAEAIEKLLSDNNLREEMGRRGRKIVEQKYTAEKVINETLELYQRALK